MLLFRYGWDKRPCPVAVGRCCHMLSDGHIVNQIAVLPSSFFLCPSGSDYPLPRFLLRVESPGSIGHRSNAMEKAIQKKKEKEKRRKGGGAQAHHKDRETSTCSPCGRCGGLSAPRVCVMPHPYCPK